MVNLDEYESVGSHCIPFYVNDNDNDNDYVNDNDSLQMNILQKRILKMIGDKSIPTMFYRIQAYDSTMCEYFYIGYINLC